MKTSYCAVIAFELVLVACGSSGDKTTDGSGGIGGAVNGGGASGAGIAAGASTSNGGASGTGDSNGGASGVPTGSAGGVNGTGATAGTGGAGMPTQNWAMFGHDYNNSRASDDTTITAASVVNLSVKTRVVGGGVASTPSIVDGTAYYADFYGHAKAVNANTGAVVWDTLAQRSADVGGLPPMLTPSAFVSSDTVYTGGNAGWVYALNRTTGAVKWRTQIETKISSRVSSSPVVIGNTLIIGSGSYQVFVPAQNAADLFYGNVKGLDATTGEILWTASVCSSPSCGSGVSVWSSAAVDPNLKLAFIGTGQAYSTPAGDTSDSLVAIDYTNGHIKWSHQYTQGDIYTINTTGAASYGKDHDVGASPNLFTATINGTVHNLVGVGDKGGHYAAFDRANGTMAWDTNLGYGSAIGGVMHSTAYSNGFIYVVNNTSVTGTGRNDAIPASSSVMALDAATGAVKWKTPLNAGGFGGISIANGLMYFMTWDGQLRVFDTAKGTLLKSVLVSNTMGTYVAAPTDGFPNGSASGPVVSNGHVYVGYGWTWVATITGGLAILQ